MTLLGLLTAMYTQLYLDYPTYWAAAPLPFHVFLATQTTLLCLLAYQLGKVREPSSRTTTLITTLSIVLLISSTTQGLKWFLRIKNHEYLDLITDEESD